MKILILTQIVDYNDDVLGFMHGWIAEFAQTCEQVTVICLKKGQADLPANVKVLSLGKEDGRSRIKYVVNFYKYIWRERKNYDIVLAHMNYEYINLGGIFWRLLGKKVGLWYAHGHVPFGLVTAEKITNLIFTSTKSGCRLNSKKVNVVGQGIDVEKFKVVAPEARLNNRNQIISIGRISLSKDYETLIKAVEILKRKNLKLKVQIVGGPAVQADEKYFSDLKRQLIDKKLTEEIKFVGPVANKDIINYLVNAAVFVNMGQTGSLDKAMVEAMAVELPVLTCNEAMLEVLGNYKTELMYAKKDSQGLADKIESIINMPGEQYLAFGKNLRQLVIDNHSLKKFVNKILNLY